jgi:beta-glucosidase
LETRSPPKARAKYNEAQRQNDHGRYVGLTFWSPNVNIFRDPRWGRGQETYGEDPFLAGRMAVAFVQGLQGYDPHYLKVIATPKHFAVHSGPEPLRHGFNVDVSPHDLEDTYLPAFRAAIVEGKADSIMCAYNAVEKSPACANDLLLQRHLREDWKFHGYVVSDCDAIADVSRGHHFAADDAHASAVSLRAGTDLDCGATYKQLGEAVREGLVQEKELDTAVVRLFTARFRLGMFDPAENVPFSNIAMTEVDSPSHRRLALRAARESIVLLQNREGLLPLKSPKRIVVIGPTAELQQSIEGNYTATAPHPVLPLDGIEKQFRGSQVSFAPGSVLAEGLRTPIPSSAFRVKGSSPITGLRAEYFDNLTFAGAPKLARIDRNINFNWGQVGPARGFDSKRFSVRWSGTLVPPGAGTYTLAFRGAPAPVSTRVSAVVDPTGENVGPPPPSSSLKVYLDGQIILDTANDMLTSAQTFSDTQEHALRIEYVHAAAVGYFSFEWLPPAEPMLDQAVAAARISDLVVAFVGLSPDLEGEQMKVRVDGFNGGDRTDIGLPAVQERLLEAVKATGKPLVVVLTSGSAIAANWADQHADAMLEVWYDGEETGTAIAETLAGVNNPSGRLPITFYRDLKDLPPFQDYSMRNRTYRYFDGPVLYPFGYGLSYSSFEYRKPLLSSDAIAAGKSFTASVSVRNASPLAGDEVVELYVRAPHDAGEEHPSLAGFQRVHLAGGETKHIAISVDARQLSRVDEAGARHIAQGEYTISVGGGQPQYSLAASITLRVVGTTDTKK